MNPRVSILIPTYDRPYFLHDAIASALRQTVMEVEILVGDDGDCGRAAVEEFNDRRVHYVKRCPRLGMAPNWQALLDEARAPFMALLMDDDRLEPRFAERCLEHFAVDPELGVVFTNHTFARSGQEDRVRRCELPDGRHDAFARQFLRLKPVAVSAAMIRREAWRDAWPLPNTAAADMVLFVRIAEAGWPFFYVDEPLMRYREHPAMYSGSRAFRDDCVAAWEAVMCHDPAAQRERNRLLADALLSRAAARLMEGSLQHARIDTQQALKLGPSSHMRGIALTIAASHTILGLVARRIVEHRRGCAEHPSQGAGEPHRC